MRKLRITTIGLAAAVSVSSLLSVSAASAGEERPEPRAAATENAPQGKGPASAAGTPSASKPIKDEYIVTLKPGKDPEGVARGVGASPRFTYRSALNGFAGRLTDGQLNALRHNPDVASIEQDQEGGIGVTQTMDAAGQPWGLDRIDQRNLPLSKSYSYNATAGAVRVYVIDSGLQANHPQFGSRALNMYSALGGSAADCNGHGTHVAGTIGGTTYGVAKNVQLRGVRVVDCDGKGSTSAAIAGVDWVRVNSIAPAVANMSLQYGKSTALNQAVYNLAESGVFVAAAAGNFNVDACTVSPASAYGAYTTGATTSGDARSIWSGGQASNWGACLDGNAPGTSIKSAYLNSGTASLSGTSMASPHIAGVAALYKATYGNAGWLTIRDWINVASTKNVITGLPVGTPNRLLYKAAL